MKPSPKRRLGAVLLAAWIAGFAAERGAAAEQGMYVGVAAGAGRLTGSFDKRLRIAGPACAGCPTSRDVSETGAADDALLELGALAGYRLPLRGRLFAALEADAQWSDGGVAGAHRGEGTQYTDLWPERWEIDKRRSVGLALRFGARARSQTDVYALLGYRAIRTSAQHANIGCRVAEVPCPVAPQPGGSGGRQDYGAWALGIGVGRAVGAKTVFQAELRRVDWRGRLWRHYDEGALIVNSGKDARDATLVLRAIRYL